MKYEFKPNTIYCGDNIMVMEQFPDECVDLVYIDPPFFSNKTYAVIWKDGSEMRSFEDRWKGGIDVYIEWMRTRIEHLHRMLKPTGSFYLHCDYHAGHYLKVMCDGIFGYNNFRNEISWYYPNRWTNISSSFQRVHDIILFYTKTSENTFNILYKPLKKSSIKRYDKVDKDGRRYGNHIKNGKRRVIYLDESKGVAFGDVWKINLLGSTTKERLGYPTQKPEELLDRIIKASSNKGDIVFDAFCGCGTTLAVAVKLDRQFVGIDVSPTACRLVAKRILYKSAEIKGMPHTMAELHKLPPFEFQNWICRKMGGKSNPKKTVDGGIDGWIPISEYGGNVPIEIKQHNIGRPDVDKFITVLRRHKKKAGYMVGFHVTKGAYEAGAEAKTADGLNIIFKTVEELLEE